MATLREWFSHYSEILPSSIIKFPLIEEDGAYGIQPPWQTVSRLVAPLSHPLVQAAMDLVFDDGFGTQEVPSFVLWTDANVFSIHEYDGSSFLISVPRHPPKYPS